MKLEYALEIDTQTEFTDEALGLYGGVFRLVTGVEDYSFEGQTFYSGVLLRDGFSEISKTVDINDSGAYATLSMFSAKLKNTSGLSDYLREKQIFLQNCEVRFFLVADGVFSVRWGGVVDGFPFDDNTMTIECVDSSRKIHKNLPISQANDKEMVPVALGRNLSTKLVETQTTGETLEVCGVIPFENTPMSAVSPVAFEEEEMLVYVGSLPSVGFIEENYFKDYYATCISGRGKGLSRKVVASSVPEAYKAVYNKIPQGYSVMSAVVRLTFERPWAQEVIDEETGETEWVIDLSPRVNNTEYFVGEPKSYLTFSKMEKVWRASEFPVWGFDQRDSLTTRGLYTDKASVNGLSATYSGSEVRIDSLQIDDDGKAMAARIEKPTVKFSLYSKFEGQYNDRRYYSQAYTIPPYQIPADPMRQPIESDRLTDDDLTSVESTGEFRHKCFGVADPLVSFADSEGYTPVMFGGIAGDVLAAPSVFVRMVFPSEAGTADERTPSMAGRLRVRWGAAVETIALTLTINTAVYAVAKDGRTRGNYAKPEGPFTQHQNIEVTAVEIIDGWRYGSIDVNSFSPESLFGKGLGGINFYNKQLSSWNLSELEEWVDRIDYRVAFRLSGMHSRLIGVAFDLQECGISVVERIELKPLYCGTWGEEWGDLAVGRKVGFPQSPEDLIEYLMRRYDGITAIDTGSFDAVNTGLRFAQQITARTDTIDLLINLLDQSFLMLTMGDDGSRKLIDWMSNKTPIAEHSTAGDVVANSFSGIERVPLSQVYTGIRLEYDWDGSEFKSVCLVTNTDKPFAEGSVTGGALTLAQAEIIWGRFAAAYKRTKKQQDAPPKIAQNKWLRHNTTDKTDSVFGYLDRLSRWVTVPREIISYRIPVESSIGIDVGSTVSFEDVILTGGSPRIGWVIEWRLDPVAAQVELTVLLDNDPLDPFSGEEIYIDEDGAPLDSLIDEEDADDEIDEETE